LQKEVDKNESSIADELDKVMCLDESNRKIPFTEGAQRGLENILSRHIGNEPIIISVPKLKDELDKKLGVIKNEESK
jgi:hypothetical protein